MALELWLAGILVGAFVLYALLGGADFGGGVWDLLAAGPRKAEQRALIAHAIGPVWEVNHVWLIIGVVLLFSGFPRAFAALSVALHVPLTLLLVGIVMRGAAFTFRTYDARGDAVQRRWGLLFSVASLVSPLLLGACVGALASGAIRLQGRVVTSGFFQPWTRPFPIAVGFLCLGLFAFLAAVYLAAEAESAELQEDFRRRALGSGGLLFLLAATVLWLARDEAPRLFQGLTRGPWALQVHLATALAALSAFALLLSRRFHAARVAAALQGGLIVVGWALSQYPYLVLPDLTLQAAASRPQVLKLLLGVLALGSALVLPSLWLLYRVFGRGAQRGPAPSPARH